jgi:hypothetical protein
MTVDTRTEAEPVTPISATMLRLDSQNGHTEDHPGAASQSTKDEAADVPNMTADWPDDPSGPGDEERDGYWFG